MRLYEITKDLQELLSMAFAVAEEHDGVIPDWLDEHIADLELDRERLLSYFAGEYANQLADVAAYKSQKDKFTKWEKAAKNKADWIKTYLSSVVKTGEKWSNDQHRISWRQSESVNVDCEVEKLDPNLVKIKAEPDKTAIKKALKLGLNIAGCSLIKNHNIQIK